MATRATHALEPRRPTHRARWRTLREARPTRAYRRNYLHVVSELEAGEWHVAVSSIRMGTVTDADLELVREEFGMQAAVEARSTRGGRRVRHLWQTAARV